MGVRQLPEEGFIVNTESETVSRGVPGETRASQQSLGSTLMSTPEVSLSMSPNVLLSEDGRFETRYEVLGRIGRGGMGEVLLCRDQRIGREVAAKVLRSDHGSRSDSVQRFQREARIQGQLEHPSVAPVYDLGVRQDGSIYFTMRRMRGLTLEEVIEKLRAGDPASQLEYNLRRLLGVFSRVCLAVEFAHRRGVVHRDLKPANVILGDYGEVYVLDWGIAKVLGSDTEEANGSADRGAAQAVPLETPDSGDSARTVAGTVLGTIGYMAPEQAAGGAADVTERADVYSLGAILFELLTLHPLHPTGNAQAALRSTLFGAAVRPSERAPERGITPELDELCMAALAYDPSTRLETARELHERVERYLDGERDSERRRELAHQRVIRAERVLSDPPPPGSSRVRQYAAALSELNAALVIDPSNEEALRSLLRALSDTPDELPAGEQDELLAARRAERRTAAKRSALAYVGVFCVVLVLGTMHVRSAPALAAIGGAALLCAGYSWWMGASGRTSIPYVFVGLLFAALVCGTVSVLFGPLIAVPSVAVATTVVIMVHSRAGALVRWIIAGVNGATFLVPVLLSALGALPTVYSFPEGALAVMPWAVYHSAGASIALLILISLLSLIIPTLLIGRSIDAMAKAERRLHVQAWYFEQVVAQRLRRAAP